MTTRTDLTAVRARRANPYAVLRWLVAATFIVILNETIMINAIPRLMVEFEVTARAAQWLSTAFMLTMAVVIPVTGWFLQKVSTRTAYVVAMTTFCTGTLVAALAPVFPVLLAGRVVQATGTAVMMPLLMTTLMTIVPEHDRGRVMGNVTLAMSVAPALGPAVSGVVLQWLSWRWMFGLVLPVALVLMLLGARRLERTEAHGAGSVDWASVAAAALGFGGLVYGLSRLGAENTGGLPALPTVVVSLAVVAALAALTTVTSHTAAWFVLVAHVLLMASLAAVFTPVFTVGLGALPMHLYSHGSSLLGTLQQVAAAVGTAVVVTVMSWRAGALANGGADAVDALVGGMRWAFGFGALTALGVVAMALLLPAKAVAEEPEDSVDPFDVVEDVA